MQHCSSTEVFLVKHILSFYPSHNCNSGWISWWVEWEVRTRPLLLTINRQHKKNSSRRVTVIKPLRNSIQIVLRIVVQYFYLVCLCNSMSQLIPCSNLKLYIFCHNNRNHSMQLTINHFRHKLLKFLKKFCNLAQDHWLLAKTKDSITPSCECHFLYRQHRICLKYFLVWLSEALMKW